MRVFRLSSCGILVLLLLSAVACGGGGGGIEGTVTVGGQPVEGVSVRLLPGSGFATGATGATATEEDIEPVATATTDADGHFALDAEPGDYTISIQGLQVEGAPGGCNVLMPAVTVDGGSTTVNFDVPGEPPSTGITFVDPFWFACFEA